MNRSGKGLLIAAVIGIVMFGFSVTPAHAQIDPVDGVLNLQLPPPSCIDSADPEIACFGSDVLLTLPPDNPYHDCLAFANTCSLGCVNAETSSLAACSKLTDPIDRANCVAIAETTAYACLDDCQLQANTICPNP